MTVEIITPEEYLGDVVADIAKRRGVVERLEDSITNKIVVCEVALAEMFGYSTALRSMTQGRGSYNMELSAYNEVPEKVSQSLISIV